MTGLDIRVDGLALTLDVPPEHRHRVDAIVRRALARFEALAPAALDRLGAPARRVDLESLPAGAVAADLGREGDDEVAERIAGAWLDALRTALR
ncbi:MAG TPA: hypothetical protein VFP89_09635 [Propionibacteriaceae bacterium]|nr:hypothetical protein [Propionibacteriaceae bacterium]